MVKTFVFNQPCNTPKDHLKTAYEIAGQLTNGGLSKAEKSMVIHQWAEHIKFVLQSKTQVIHAVRRTVE